MGKHLWEVDHAYYCEESNWFASVDAKTHVDYRRWSDFYAEQGENDKDLNLLFRWDWIEQSADGEPTYNGDDNYQNGTLKLFFMGQRKGLYRWATIEVCRADEPAVVAYLQPRLDYLMELWSPLLPPPQAGEAE